LAEDSSGNHCLGEHIVGSCSEVVVLDHTRCLWRSRDPVVQVENCRIELRSYCLENTYLGRKQPRI
jgi:hypothetical protein